MHCAILIMRLVSILRMDRPISIVEAYLKIILDSHSKLLRIMKHISNVIRMTRISGVGLTSCDSKSDSSSNSIRLINNSGSARSRLSRNSVSLDHEVSSHDISGEEAVKGALGMDVIHNDDPPQQYIISLFFSSMMYLSSITTKEPNRAILSPSNPIIHFHHLFIFYYHYKQQSPERPAIL